MPLLGHGVVARNFGPPAAATAKMCCSALDPKKGCKTSTKYTIGNQDSRLGPSWVLVLVSALEITVEQSPLAL